MNYKIIKPIVGGLILGSILFFFPFFVLKVFGFMVILGLIFWFFRGSKTHWKKYAMVHPDKIRSMSDEEYEDFKINFGSSRCYHSYSKNEHNTKKN